MAAGSRIAMDERRDGASACAPALLDLLDPEVRSDPYPHYARLRRSGPVHWIPLGDEGAWAVTRYEDCLALLTDPRFVPCDAPRTPFLFHGAGSGSILERRLVAALTPRSAESLRVRLADAAIALVHRAEGAREIDLVERFFAPLAVTAPCELLGVESDDRRLLAAWVFESRRREAAEEALRDYFREHVARRRALPGDDLLSTTLESLPGEAGVETGELPGLCVALLQGAGELGVALMANGARALLLHPDEAERVRRDSRLAVPAVEECARWEAPLQLTARAPAREIEFGGVRLAAGAPVWALLGSANRDPDLFEDPDAFRVDRRGPPHLAFGFGAQVCPSAHMARVGAQLALRLLLRRFPALEACAAPLDWRAWGFTRCPARLTVRLRP